MSEKKPTPTQISRKVAEYGRIREARKVLEAKEAELKVFFKGLAGSATSTVFDGREFEVPVTQKEREVWDADKIIRHVGEQNAHKFKKMTFYTEVTVRRKKKEKKAS